MSKSQLLRAPLRATVTILILALAVIFNPPRAQAQATAYPPERMTYQGFLADGNGVALATNAPKNYDVVFRIWDAQSGGIDSLWAEQQTVTVDKGYFSVLLGEGTPVGAEDHANLSTLFTNTTASDRFVEMTVKGIGSGGNDVTILPRLRLLTSPYSYLATSATKLINTANGGDLVTSSGGTVIVNGPITAASPANILAGNGAGLTSLNGANINNGSIDLNKLVAAVQQSLCPPGTILAYAGDTAPAGWIMCDGAYGQNPASYPALFAKIGYRFGGFTQNGIHYFLVPDLRGRFLRGRDNSAGRDPDRAVRTAMYPEGATGDAVGSVQTDQFRSHRHTETRFIDSGNDPARSTPIGDASGQLETANTGATGGNETRPVNAYVNYIIKY